MTGDDEAWSESMTYRPVRVRSRPIFRFPVGIRFGAASLRVSHLTAAETLYL